MSPTMDTGERERQSRSQENGMLVPEQLKDGYHLEGIESLDVEVENDEPSLREWIKIRAVKIVSDVPGGVIAIIIWEIMIWPLLGLAG